MPIVHAICGSIIWRDIAYRFNVDASHRVILIWLIVVFDMFNYLLRFHASRRGEVLDGSG